MKTAKIIAIIILFGMLLMSSCEQQVSNEATAPTNSPLIVSFNFIPQSITKDSQISVSFNVINKGNKLIEKENFKVILLKENWESISPSASLTEDLPSGMSNILTIDNIRFIGFIPDNEIKKVVPINFEHRLKYDNSIDFVVCFVNPITYYDATKKAICSPGENRISNGNGDVRLVSINIQPSSKEYADVIFTFSKVSNLKLIASDSINDEDMREVLADSFKGRKNSVKIRFKETPANIDDSESYCYLPNEKGGSDRKSLSDLSSFTEVYFDTQFELKCRFKINSDGQNDLNDPSLYGFKSFGSIKLSYVAIGKLSANIEVIQTE